MLTSTNLWNEVFVCPEESDFYSDCLESLVLSQCHGSEAVVEFGSGDGAPVINTLLKSNFKGIIYGFEINSAAYRLAKSRIQSHNLSSKYSIQNCCFFEEVNVEAEYLVSNPPYLPALDDKLYQPRLHGGTDGTEIARRLLSLGYDNVLLMVSSYSNPEGLINYAASQGYSVSNFLVSPLRFGYYSSEPKVKNTIVQLRQHKKAFYSSNIYLLAGVLFKKQTELVVDLSQELIQVLTAL